MVKTKKVKETIESTKIVDILCNKCGKTCNNAKRYYKGSKETYYEGVENLEIGFGYYSKIFGDMTSIRFSLCEECISEFVKTFKIPHEEKNDHTDYVSVTKMPKILEKSYKQSNKEWVKAILEKQKELKIKKYTKKELIKMDSSKYYDIFYNLKN